MLTSTSLVFALVLEVNPSVSHMFKPLFHSDADYRAVLCHLEVPFLSKRVPLQLLCPLVSHLRPRVYSQAPPELVTFQALKDFQVTA